MEVLVHTSFCVFVPDDSTHFGFGASGSAFTRALPEVLEIGPFVVWTIFVI